MTVAGHRSGWAVSFARQAVWLLLLLLLPALVSADQLRVAVASNFAGAMTALGERFEAHTGHRLSLVIGATGKLYAQIRNGAPFDVLFAADEERPRLLEDQGLALPGSRFTYARGRLVLWSPRPGYVDSEGRVLERAGFTHLAIANPRLAPYGAAARELLQARGLWQGLQGQLVRGENIAQTYQFVGSGNAELGLVAYAQILDAEGHAQGSYWLVPAGLYRPIEQQAVLLRDSATARDLLAFVKGDEAGVIIRAHGYDR